MILAENQGANEERGSFLFSFLSPAHTGITNPLKFDGLFVRMLQGYFFMANAKTIFCW